MGDRRSILFKVVGSARAAPERTGVMKRDKPFQGNRVILYPGLGRDQEDD
jgi:hypothetical protein